jgi:glycerate kinase
MKQVTNHRNVPRHILIVPDKFKGTLTAAQAAAAMASGWSQARPGDRLDLLPMSDGGDGFGQALAPLLQASPRITSTVDAAHRPRRALWWWNPRTRVAVIESAQVIGLASLPGSLRNPFQLDSYGLARVLKAAKDARTIYLGLGGSATNDGGFGLARALGWRFLDASGRPIREWWQLPTLARLIPPQTPWAGSVVVALDVKNPLLGSRGCSAVYGPQKGLKPGEVAYAEAGLRRLCQVVRRDRGVDFSKSPGAGAAGGLGFGLMTFLGATCVSGFRLFADLSHLEERIRTADCVVTGEGSIDAQTFMGKGVGEVARLCRRYAVPCIGLAGRIDAPELAKRHFSSCEALIPFNPKQNRPSV